MGRRRKRLRFLFGPILDYRANLDAEKPQRTACGFFMRSEQADGSG